jgi:hypothetical protein
MAAGELELTYPYAKRFFLKRGKYRAAFADFHFTVFMFRADETFVGYDHIFCNPTIIMSAVRSMQVIFPGDNYNSQLQDGSFSSSYKVNRTADSR